MVAKDMLSRPVITVSRSGVFSFPNLDTKDQACLISLEENKNIPFEIRRVYYLTDFRNVEMVRGEHAHRKNEQILICVHGSFELVLDDGKESQVVFMDNPCLGVRLGTMLWHSMRNPSHDCVILVLASEHYEEADYIRSYDDFIALTRNAMV